MTKQKNTAMQMQPRLDERGVSGVGSRESPATRLEQERERERRGTWGMMIGIGVQEDEQGEGVGGVDGGREGPDEGQSKGEVIRKRRGVVVEEEGEGVGEGAPGGEGREGEQGAEVKEEEVGFEEEGVELSEVGDGEARLGQDGQLLSSENRYLAVYVSIGGLVGLLLPLLHMLYCLLVKDVVSIHASAPHLFLLSAQIFLEGVSFGYDFSLPARAAVPIIYNTKRLFTIAAWVQRVMVRGGLSVGVVIALANAAFWGFNLLGFLLPVYLPRALKLHYCNERS